MPFTSRFHRACLPHVTAGADQSCFRRSLSSISCSTAHVSNHPRSRSPLCSTETTRQVYFWLSCTEKIEPDRKSDSGTAYIGLTWPFEVSADYKRFYISDCWGVQMYQGPRVKTYFREQSLMYWFFSAPFRVTFTAHLETLGLAMSAERAPLSSSVWNDNFTSHTVMCSMNP